MYEKTDAMLREIIKIDDKKDCNSISRPDIDSSQTSSNSSDDKQGQRSRQGSARRR